MLSGARDRPGFIETRGTISANQLAGATSDYTKT